MIKSHLRAWASRILIFPVLAVNMMCALQFLVNAQGYQAAFDLTGEPGRIAIQSVGILFVMWSVPYTFAVVDPKRFHIALVCAIIMQAIGILGETTLYTSIPPYLNARVAVLRFIIFDTAGFLLMLTAFTFTYIRNK